MIITIGVTKDRTIRYVNQYLQDSGIKFIFIDLQWLEKMVVVHEDYITFHGKKIVFGEISGVFVRMIGDIQSFADNPIFLANYQLLIYLLDTKINNVINRPNSTATNFSKPFQLSLCNYNEIHIPETFVFANTLIPLQNKNYIYKSVSSQRSIVAELTPDDFAREVTHPTQFQEKLLGINLRVHVVDKFVHCCAIKSDRLDYRYGKEFIEFEECHDLKDSIKQQCVEMTASLGLVFSGIDLILTNNNYCYLLEVNTCPGYDSFEENISGYPVSEKLIEYLQGCVL